MLTKWKERRRAETALIEQLESSNKTLRHTMEKAFGARDQAKAQARWAMQEAKIFKKELDQYKEVHKKLDEANLEAKARWTSPDGKKVLRAFNEALNLIRNYQKALNTLMAPDPNWNQAKTLLEEWGMQAVRGAPDGLREDVVWDAARSEADNMIPTVGAFKLTLKTDVPLKELGVEVVEDAEVVEEETRLLPSGDDA